jgi:hypothetical protein
MLDRQQNAELGTGFGTGFRESDAKPGFHAEPGF